MLASLIKSPTEKENSKENDHELNMHRLLYKFTILLLDEFIYNEHFNALFSQFYETEKVVSLSSEADHNLSYGIEFIRRLLIERQRNSL